MGTRRATSTERREPARSPKGREHPHGPWCELVSTVSGVRCAMRCIIKKLVARGLLVATFSLCAMASREGRADEFLIPPQNTNYMRNSVWAQWLGSPGVPQYH